MRYYIATSLERHLHHNALRDLLEARGHSITYDWTEHGSVKHESQTRIAEVAHLEAMGVHHADFVVVLLPGGRGTHTELGLAIAYGKPVFVHAHDHREFFAQDDRTCAFYHHPQVAQVTGDYTKLPDTIENTLRSRKALRPHPEVGEQARRRAKMLLDEWTEVTGVLPQGTSWYYEVESLMDDAVALALGAYIRLDETPAPWDVKPPRRRRRARS